jgi:two-component system response regulator MtrA
MAERDEKGIPSDKRMTRILVVDDDESVLEAICLILEDEGFAVTAARSGAEALDVLRGQPVDLVVLDVLIPDMDGLDLCRRIRAEPRVAHLPILFLTAMSQVENIRQASECGANGYLLKPDQILELPARVRVLLA